MGGSGSGARPVPAEIHVARGTFRRDRHARPTEASVPLSPYERRKTLDGLPPAAKRQGAQLLDAFEGWDASSRFTLRLYVLSCDRLAKLQAMTGEKSARVRDEVRRETGVNLALLKALGLERPRW